MTTKRGCNCYVQLDHSIANIVWCPLHEHAEELVEACEMALEGKGDWRGYIDLVLSKVKGDMIKHRGTELEGIAIANQLGIGYDGIQEGIGMQFTDVNGTGTSFYADTLEEARAELAKKRRLFRLGVKK